MRTYLLVGVIGLVACSSGTTEDVGSAVDSGAADSISADSSAADSARADSSPTDSAVADSSSSDSSTSDSSSTDSSSTDSSTDAKPTDAGAFCGGIAGIKCPTGSFCAQALGTCKVADAGGTCKPIPAACTKELMPVCGCDGKTYGNACMAEMASMSVASTGECATAKSCGGKLGGTCAATEWCDYPSDGVACGAADGTGTCQPRPSLCPDLFAPVCGCNGTTYGNACEAHRAGTDDQTTGTCGK